MGGAARRVVTLRPMTDAEFPVWREIAVEHHAAQVSHATGKSLDAATKESRALLAKLLPVGLATPGMNFFVVLDESEREVGWLWLGASPQDPDAGFVFDIIIDANARRRGCGRAAMRAVEQFFEAEGRLSIGLDVAGGNEAARALYESMGYRPIMTSMRKSLDHPREVPSTGPAEE
jgi:ribosomal protein S18 acetylase RimI-like enzyme